MKIIVMSGEIRIITPSVGPGGEQPGGGNGPYESVFTGEFALKKPEEFVEEDLA